MQYRPELDGLRAIAVLSVVLFHAGVPGVSGGFVGVDVFFVLSGFLITRIIFDEHASGNFSLVRFWERRIRRIIPALLFTCLVTFGLGMAFLLPNDLNDLARAFRYLAISSSNILFWRETGYFGFTTNQVPLLHTWSLSVEEQFYILFPPTLMILFAFLSKRKVWGVMFLGFIASFTLAIIMLDRSRWGTFYLLPTRAWELLAGSLVAGVFQKIRVKAITTEFLAFIGLAMILIAVVAYDEATPFPAQYALPPVLGAVLVIVSATAPRTQSHSYPWLALGLMRSKLMVLIGLVSYSFYLMHWPFLVFVNYVSISRPSLTVRLFAVIGSLVVAMLMYKFIEQPFRQNRTVLTRGRVFLGAAFSIAILLAISEYVRVGRGLPERFSDKTVQFATSKGDAQYLVDGSIEAINSGKWISIGSPNNDASALLVWGDSHAMAALPAFDEFLKQTNQSGIAMVRSSTPPVVGYSAQTVNSFEDPMTSYNACVREKISEWQVKNVVMIGFWNAYLSNPDNKDRFANCLIGTVEGLVKEGVNVSIVLQTPHLSFDAPRALAIDSFQLHFGEVEDLLISADKYAGLCDGMPGLEQRLEAAGAHLIPLVGAFTRSDGKLMAEKDGISLYRDNQHLTVKGAKTMLLPVLESHSKDLLSGVSSTDKAQSRTQQ